MSKLHCLQWGAGYDGLVEASKEIIVDGPVAPVVRDLKLDMPRWVYELDDDETVQVPREVVLRDGG